jgi:hypothetical protein
VSGWVCLLDMSWGAFEGLATIVKIYNLCYLNHRAHIEGRAFLPFSVTSVVNIGMSNFTPGECVRISAGHEPGSRWGECTR